MENTQIVLVPGFWLGAWAWDDVAVALRERGYDVLALTLPGRGDGSVADRGSVTAQDQADAVADALDARSNRRVLVVHSGAAIPGTLVIDQHPDLVDHVVWVDTAPTPAGSAMNTELAGDALLLDDVWEAEMEEGSMRDLTDTQLETFRSHAVPEPGRVVREPVRLEDTRRHDTPGTVVCTSFPAEDFRSYADQGVSFLAALPDYGALRYVDLPTGHWPMWSRPDELAQVIADAAG